MKSDLLDRLSKKKPEHKTDELIEALKRGYSCKQILEAMPEWKDKPSNSHIYLKYSGIKGNLEVPYTEENYLLLCRLLLD